MSESKIDLSNNQPDEEDRLARDALIYLQTTVDRRLAKAGKSANHMTDDEMQDFVDHVDPYLKFELDVSDGLYVGLPLSISGAGGFLLTDDQEELLGAQQTMNGDLITGIVSSVRTYPVPTRSIMLDPITPGQEIPCYDRSLSAVILLEAAKFYTDQATDGTFQIIHDLGEWQAVIPVIYGMDVHVADIDR